MTMSGGRDSSIWMGGTVLILLAAIVLPRFFRGREAEAPAFTTRDSAGVIIAQSQAPLWEVGEGWRVEDRPELLLGVVDGGPRYQFDDLTGMVRLEGGGVAVADGGSQEVRFYDALGEWTATAGGKGGGPGEFTGLSALGSSPDGRIWAYDFSLRRITWIGALGEVIGLTTLGPMPPTLNAVGVVSDGTFVLKQLWGSPPASEAVYEGLQRDPVAYVCFDASGELVDTVGVFPGREIFVWDEDGRGVMGTPPYARNSVGAIWEGKLVVGSQESFSLDALAPDGTLARRVSLDAPVKALGAADLEAYIQGQMEATPSERRGGLREQIEAMEMPPTRPAYGGLLADRVGNLWVAEWAQYPDSPTRWTVLDAEGQWLGTVEMPGRFFPSDIGEDWILGMQRDEMDVEYVVVYPLVKPAGSS